MTSLKGRIITSLIRKRHIFKGKLRKEKFDLNTSIVGFREECEKGAAMFGKLPEGIILKQETISEINSEWVKPKNCRKEKLIFYIHGGGYVSGSLNDHRSVVSKISDLTNTKLLHFEYRLAPEFPFPHALDDSLKVYKSVLEKGYKPENIMFMGESAGGGLAFALLLKLKEENIQFPKAAVAISPWADLSLSGASYKTKNKVSAAPLNSSEVFSHHYVGNNDPKNPLISPLFGDLKNLPPIFINSGEADELFDDGKSFYEKAKNAGVDIKFREGKDMMHCYPLLSPMFKEATEAMNEIVDFIKFHLYN